MINWIHPGFLFIFGSFIFLFVKGNSLKVLLLLIPIMAFISLINMPEGANYSFSFLNHGITFCRADKLSKVFGFIFAIMGFAGALFSIHLKTRDQHIAAFLYIGSSLGVVFAGDFISLFIFWEIMAFASTYLICIRKTTNAKKAGFRYILSIC